MVGPFKKAKLKTDNFTENKIMGILFGLLYSSLYCSSLLQLISHSVYVLTYSLLSVMGYDISLCFCISSSKCPRHYLGLPIFQKEITSLL